MSEDILVPILGESVTEATVARWLKKEGEEVTADEPVVELETDKVNLEVPSPVSGVISKINSKDGENVEVGSVLGIVTSGQSKNEDNENKQEKVPPITEKIIEEAEKIVNVDTKKENTNQLVTKNNEIILSIFLGIFMFAWVMWANNTDKLWYNITIPIEAPET